MSILEKFAKLNSKAVDSGKYIEITVYDDESNDPQEKVMWLQGRRETNRDETEFIQVDIVEFNDELFFKMPQNRQDSCASVLLKRFIKHYRENYDGMPVAADFQNYDLQEKFKVAVEKGIFPKESLELSDFTDKEQYESNEQYNMTNRKLYDIVTRIRQNGGKIKLYQNDVTAEGIWGAYYFNASIEDVFDIAKELNKTITTLNCKLDHENVAFVLEDFPSNADGMDFEYDVNSNSIKTPDNPEEENDFLDYLSNPSHPFHRVFNSVSNGMQINTTTNGTKQLSDIIIAASIIKRLMRKRGKK